MSELLLLVDVFNRLHVLPHADEPIIRPPR